MHKSALLIIDVQKDVVSGAHDLSNVVSRINTLIDKARASKTPVVWVQHSDEYLVKDSLGWEFVDDLQPREDEVRIYKTQPSSFEGTPLQEKLNELGVTTLVITGAQSEYCISATTQGAIDLGYDVSLVSDAHTTVDGDEGPAISIINARNEKFHRFLAQSKDVSL
ncbi:MAG: hypothetical protein RL414_12 [Actinomycetota bacterium]|jgi:nicotinamidase-related amidase